MARPPAPMTMCTVFPAHDIIHACWRALGLAAPERALAGWARNVFGVTSGTKEGADEPFRDVPQQPRRGGGAIEGRDGFNQIGHLCTLGGLTIPNLEVYEQIYPVRYLRQEFRCRFRRCGGAIAAAQGVDYALEVMVPALYSFGARACAPPRATGSKAASGARQGRCCSRRMTDPSLSRPPQFGLMQLGPLHYEAASPGGGGWGDPKTRDPQAVLADLRDGIISAQAGARNLRGGARRRRDEPRYDADAGAARRLSLFRYRWHAA